ncbi:uncharacterized protein [Ptychodera flava]|uniref:uncharacterized protein n=1 Tax=Ptychodera flava TaxID=63121 RepID=UPI00396A75F8
MTRRLTSEMVPSKHVKKGFFITLVVGICCYLIVFTASNRRYGLTEHLGFLRETVFTYSDLLRKGQNIPMYDVCFIKTRKTASTTLSSILNRYALTHNLSLALMKTNKRSGHFNIIPIREDSPRKLFLPPLGVKPGDWTNYKYNMMTVHVRYNRSAFETFMNPGTKYISILRETCSHFESDFVYYKIPAVVKSIKKNISIEETLQEYFRDPKFYWEKTMKKYGKTIKFYTRNVQIFDLGLDHIYHNDADVLNTFIRKLEDEIDLMLITEYFDESLLLLKKLLHWDWNDVMYIARNARAQNATRVTLTSDLCSKIRKWNRADYLLYQTFNKTLWKRIKAYGKDWERDMNELKRRFGNVRLDCSVTNATKTISNRRQVVYKTRNSSLTMCKLLTEYNNNIIGKIRQKQSSGYYLINSKGSNQQEQQLTCGFEYRANCGFKFAGENGYEWTFDPTLRVKDATTNSTEGTFLVAKYNTKRKTKTKMKANRARATAVELLGSHSRNCLSFNYYLSKNIVSRNFTFRVCLLPDTKAKFAKCDTVWKMVDSAVYSGRWNHVSLNISTTDTAQVAFEAISGQFPPSKNKSVDPFIGLDDVSVERDKSCPNKEAVD